MKTKKTLILLSGIFFILAAVSLLLTGILCVTYFNTTFLELIRFELEQLVYVGEMTSQYVESIMGLFHMLMWFLAIYSFVFCIVDIVLGVLLIKRSNASDEVLREGKGLLIASLIVSFLGGSLVTIILLIIALSIKEKPENVVVKPENVPYSVTDTVETKFNVVNEKYESKIRKLQTLRDSGAITKEEYEILLKQVFKD